MKMIASVLVLLLLGFGAWHFLGGKSDDQPRYLTTPVARGDLTQAVTATGQLNPVKNVTVGSQISGIIAEIFVDFNSPVKANQVVARLDAASYQAIVHQSEGDLGSGRAALELAQLTAKRKQELVKKNAAAQADLDAALAALHQAEATVQIKTGNLERAKVDLNRCTIFSPIDGTVISRNVDVGQTVAAAMNAPVLFTIANDLTKMQIDANVAEADVGTVEVAQNVDFTVDAFPYQVFHGAVAQVRNAATTVQNVVTYDVVISVDNAELKLKPGMTASVSIVVAQRENVLKIPNAALRFRLPEETPPRDAPAKSVAMGDAYARRGHQKPRSPERTIYIWRGGNSAPQPAVVRTGVTDGITTEILDGVNEGDPIVTSATAVGSQAPAATNPFGGGPRRF